MSDELAPSNGTERMQAGKDGIGITKAASLRRCEMSIKMMPDVLNPFFDT
jgi:hypothetical protein